MVEVQTGGQTWQICVGPVGNTRSISYLPYSRRRRMKVRRYTNTRTMCHCPHKPDQQQQMRPAYEGREDVLVLLSVVKTGKCGVVGRVGGVRDFRNPAEFPKGGLPRNSRLRIMGITKNNHNPRAPLLHTPGKKINSMRVKRSRVQQRGNRADVQMEGYQSRIHLCLSGSRGSAQLRSSPSSKSESRDLLLHSGSLKLRRRDSIAY